MGRIQVTFETQRQTTEIEIVHGYKLTSCTPTDIHKHIHKHAKTYKTFYVCTDTEY